MKSVPNALKRSASLDAAFVFEILAVLFISSIVPYTTGAAVTTGGIEQFTTKEDLQHISPYLKQII